MVSKGEIGEELASIEFKHRIQIQSVIHAHNQHLCVTLLLPCIPHITDRTDICFVDISKQKLNCGKAQPQSRRLYNIGIA